MNLRACVLLFFSCCLILPAGIGNACYAQAPAGFNLTGLSMPATCGQADGTITVTPHNGEPTYIYCQDYNAVTGLGTWQNSSTFSGFAQGVYPIWCKDASGNVVSVSVIVNSTCLNMNATTVVNSSCGLSNGSILAGASGGTPSYQYSLDGGNTYQSGNSFLNLAPGPYTVTAKDANGKTGVLDVTVGNLPGPTITNTLITPTSCAAASGTVTITTSGGTAPLAFSLDSIPAQPGAVFSGLPLGNYQATVKDVNGCTANAPVIIPLNNTLTVNAGNATTICQGTGTDLNGQSNASSITSITWQPSTGLNKTSILDPVASPDVTTKYYLEVVSGVCHAVDSVIITVNPAPIADAGANDTICYGISGQLNGSGGETYLWSPLTYLNSPNIPNPEVIMPPATVRYTLRVTDANHCTSLNEAAVTVVVTPPKGLSVGGDTSIAIGELLQLNAVDIDNSGFTQYEWSPSLGLNNPTIADPIANLTENVTYTVTATTAAGCLGTAIKEVKVYQHADIYVPNAFTPNGDGHNDVFRAVPVGIKTFNYLVIFNRWGAEVFHSTNPETGWNGQFNGVLQSTGAYVWAVSGVDYEGRLVQHKGTVMLIR